MRQLIAFLVVLGLGAHGAGAAPDTDASLAALLDTLFAGVPHSDIRWVGQPGLAERAALYLPVVVDGEAGWFQLDTGLDATRVYGRYPAEHGWEAHEAWVRAPGFSVADCALGPTWMLPYTQGGFGAQDSLRGSIGLDLLVGRLVVLDFIGDRFALLTIGRLPHGLLDRITWTPAAIRDAKLFLNVTVGGRFTEGLFFDTGSSAFPIVVDQPLWTTLTGCRGPEDAVEHWELNSWGDRRRAIGALAREPLVVGSARLPDALVYYLEDQPQMFAAWPFPAEGLVGCAAFWGQVVLLDLGLRPRLGLLTEE